MPMRQLHDPDFGKAVPCPSCAPKPAPQGIPESLAAVTFRDFDLALNPQMADAVKQCKKVATGDAWCALLSGPPGLGKSMLAAAAMNEAGEGVWWTWGALQRNIRQLCFGDGARLSDEDVVNGWANSRLLLVIDDIGAEMPRDPTWSNGILYGILAGRYERKLPTILTTNDIRVLEDRVLDRYRVGAVVCRGKSQRPAR